MKAKMLLTVFMALDGLRAGACSSRTKRKIYRPEHRDVHGIYNITRYGWRRRVFGQTLTPREENGMKLSTEGETSNSPGQAIAPPWVLKKKKNRPEWAASQGVLALLSFPTKNQC